ncbi:AraC-type DNA-binding protein [Amycolatopsis arida]|uniref:AraC-type DNA-binding protein n=1 Tax=Amycolatopsis arida TaxID=587909 RepID=A0A1I6AG68_9PSEU|nr:helix-turn-helix domain-containing protein [Amycolatopsis arida]TDX97715.1 AraC-like DNA-binding protein [Amycolatopsis arida]SFQ67689.1 AraC-type DNA-binding protein [Amycolatopsis arida]
MYVEHPPPTPLRPAIRCLWRTRMPERKRIVPDGCVDIVVGAGEVIVAGPDTRAWHTALPAGALVHGLRFHPGHAPRALGVAADELRDLRVPLADLWGRGIADRLLAEPAALPNVVASRLTGAPDPRLGVLLARLTAGVRLGPATAGLGLGERQLRRRFTAAVGYGPARYLRVARLQRAIRMAARAAGLADLAARAGYADHAHLCRDCQELTGLSPGAFFPAWVTVSGKPAGVPAG